MAVAACFLGVLAAANWLYGRWGLVEAYPWTQYQRDTEQMDPVRLDDGSVAQLNNHSQMRVSLTQSERRIVLDDGEAFFDVSPDAARPFDVQAGIATVRAKGTAFSLRREDDGEIQATVKHGSIEVKPVADPQRGTEAPAQPPEVKAGQVATIGPDGRLSVAEVGQTELADRLAWANPLYRLDGMTLQDAVKLFNRYNVRKLEVRDAGLGQIRVAGSFYLTEPEKFVDSLQKLGIGHVVQGVSSSPNARILLVRK